MPTVFPKDGLRFFFYSNDHTPIYFHVRKGEGESVFEIEGDVVLRESVGFRTRELTIAEKLAEENKNLIIQTWHEFFD